MPMKYEQWRAEIAALLLHSHVPQAFVDEHLANRAAMDKLYQDGFSASEVMTHLVQKYQAQRAERSHATIRRYAPVLLVCVAVSLVGLITAGLAVRLSYVFSTVEDFLIFSLIPGSMCVLPLVIMAIFWVKNR